MKPAFYKTERGLRNGLQREGICERDVNRIVNQKKPEFDRARELGYRPGYHFCIEEHPSGKCEVHASIYVEGNIKRQDLAKILFSQGGN